LEALDNSRGSRWMFCWNLSDLSGRTDDVRSPG